MHFGLARDLIKAINLYFLLLLITALTACEEKRSFTLSFAQPTQGANINRGKTITVKIDTATDSKIDSINYLVDDKMLKSNRNAAAFLLSTNNFPLGYRMITAIISHDGKKDTLTTNIVILNNQPPARLTYKLANSYPHNPQSYTEGLSYVNGRLLESTGQKGSSMLKYVDLSTGKDIQAVKLDQQYFGEGSVQIGNKIIVLTWQEDKGLIFDALTFKQLRTFPYERSREGWGLTFDGTHILRTDGSNRIWRMDAFTYKERGYIEVYDDKGPVDSLNEIEYIDGKIYANVYPTSKIVRIDPSSGAVEAELDLSALMPKNYFKDETEAQNNVLNGIAWDKSKKRLFVTGKRWPKLFEIQISE